MFGVFQLFNIYGSGTHDRGIRNIYIFVAVLWRDGSQKARKREGEDAERFLCADKNQSEPRVQVDKPWQQYDIQCFSTEK